MYYHKTASNHFKTVAYREVEVVELEREHHQLLVVWMPLPILTTVRQFLTSARQFLTNIRQFLINSRQLLTTQRQFYRYKTVFCHFKTVAYREVEVVELEREHHQLLVV